LKKKINGLIAMSDVSLTIDGRDVTVPAGTTLLSAAQKVGARIPTICYHGHCTPNGLCRICVVEVEGTRALVPACVAQASERIKVHTRNARVERSRRTILEMLSSGVDLSEAPELQEFMSEYHADRTRFPESERREQPVLDDNPMYIRDYSKCILCWRCVQVCADDAQFTYALNFSGRGFATGISTFFEKPMPETTCVFCGQCLDVCPTGALKPKREWLLERGLTPNEVMRETRSTKRKPKR
jgi:NADH dehydrogenase/NADH:ubiquinone oxidoreductase subunit G